MSLARVETLERRQLLASTRFAVIGDFGNDTQPEADVAALVKSWNPDSILTVGDNSYQTASPFSLLDKNVGKYYHEFIYNYPGIYGAGSPTRRFYPALGNHDWGNTTPGDASVYLNYFDLPGNERYYDFVQGPVHFFVLDSDTNEPDGTSAASVQGQWLKAKLAAATEPHRVILFHHPAYTSGSAHHSNLWMRWPFAKWGATAVFTGHEHSYERLSEEGIPYFVNGVGGAELAGVGTPIAGSQVRYNADFGAMKVEADDTTMTTRFYTRTGLLIDTYTIDLAANATLVNAGADWKYLVQNSVPTGNWKLTGYNEAGWSTGPAQLGYGDGDEQTVVGFGPSSTSRYTTTYFRKSFNVSNVNAITGLTLSMLRDDGAVVYLNGTRVFDSNMPAGTIVHSTLATAAIGGEDEGNWYSASIPTNLLVAGQNQIAVELHQSAANSSDISFDLSLKASLDVVAPQLSSSNFHFDATPMSLQIGFSENVGASLSTADLVLTNQTSGQTIAAGLLSLQFNSSTRIATIQFPGLPGGVLPDGNWTLSIIPTDVTDPAGNALAPAAPFPFFIFGGDANRDRRVDIADLYILASNYQQGSRTFSQGDFNGDGIVNSQDLGILSSHWQGSLPAPAAPVSIGVRTPLRSARLISTIMA